MGAIGAGIVLLIGIGKDDTVVDAALLAEKCTALRIFPDDTGAMNRSIVDTKGSILAISQFTLYADMSRGRRPGLSKAMAPAEAEKLYEIVIELLKKSQLPVTTGVFGADMRVKLTNEGPVTLILESRNGQMVR